MPPDPSKEPSAAAREVARFLFDYFNALTAEGFSEAQALSIIGAMLAANRPKDTP